MTKCLECDNVIYILDTKFRKAEYKKPAKVLAVICPNCVQRRLRGRKFGLTEDLKVKAKALGLSELLDSLSSDLLGQAVALPNEPG